MENSTKLQENQNPFLIPPPKCRGSATSTTTTNNNGVHHHHHHHHHHPSPPSTPMPITRSDPNNPYPTTFVQADTISFKKVVQMLTGSSDTAKNAAVARPDPSKNPIPPNKKVTKLFERRNSSKNFKISPLIPGLYNELSGSPRMTRSPEILSPSILDFPSLALSPVTPLIPDPFTRAPNLNVEEEDKAIAKKGFYLHPSSPANTPRGESEPRLLPLFPLTPPRVSGSPNSA